MDPCARTARGTFKNKAIALRVGELLIKEGFIQAGDLKLALEIQKEDGHEARLKLGDLMVKKGLISGDQLDSLLNHPDLRRTIGVLAVQKGLVTQEQLETCLRLKDTHELLGQAMVRRNLISQAKLDHLLREQADSVRLGELAYHLNMIGEEDLDRVLRIKSGHRTLGEIFCDMGVISADDLTYILQKYGKQLKLGDILLKQGLLSEERFQKAMQEQMQTRQKLGRILVKKKYISTDQLYQALSRQFNLPFRSLTGYAFDSRQRRTLAGLIGEKYARKHKLLPLGLRDKKLQVALSDPENKNNLGELRSMYPDLCIEPVLITQEKYDELFTALYLSMGAEREAQGLAASRDIELVDIDLRADKLEEGHANLYGGTDIMAEQVVDFIIRTGIGRGASDIHLEQDRQGARLRYRLDGICKEMEIEWLNEKLQEMPNAIISRIKVLSGLDIAERRLPQDGVFRVNTHDPESDRRVPLDFRVATCPAIAGENVTIRILDSRKAQVGLEQLNHHPDVLGPLKRLFKSSAGMILVSGPTGSGKSSTLYAALRYIYHPGIKIITAEDPIEYSFPGIMQTQIKPKIGLTFARLLRSFLRLDPDVILVGEIRDEETAAMAFDAAQTGHLLLSTLHTNDAISAVSRLLDLNIDPCQIAASLIGVLAQRLVRRICEKCKQVYTPEKSEWDLFFSRYPEQLTFYRGIGCKSCGYTGYQGRTLISELFELNRDTALAISRGLNENQLKQKLMAEGMKTMIDDGLSKLDQTTLSEIIRVVPVEMIKEYHARRCGAAMESASERREGLHEEISEHIRLNLSDPDRQGAQIDRLFSRYQELRQFAGQPPLPADESLFRRFVAETYRRMRRESGSTRILIEIERRGTETRICAAPAKEAQ